MLTKKVIDNLYKKYNSRPDSPDELDFGLLFDFLLENHGIELDEESLVINSVGPDSPFHKIPLRHIHGIVEFGDDIAIVLHSSILILNKHSSKVNIHLRPLKDNPFAALWRMVAGSDKEEDVDAL